ncbi:MULTISPECIES: NAD(P)-dependent oxidoreductase [unclassified Sphingobium]|uniref:NAD(P)-dependent oxidoreductase n=1 Tax=unclassified Sphingobium TaxID=2611147 RepID=UPI00076FEFBD|nr:MULTISPECIES: NAD(P)-dependent oxidoreductase [unclassified Sphingobium]AMK22649.1 3-hydroxyisobutyrate dehydrogenase [Sphingobium sp. TKS]NML90166.1 NAD(P)-dependent oxidoreductase [Sphingobium sp. TB-6]
MAKIAFIGLGVMGGPIAGHLAKAGHQLTVYNRSIGKAKRWAEAYGGEVAINPAKAAEDAEIVISCVGTDDDLSQITLGRDGAFRSMKPGGLFIDHTTVSARIARQLFVEGESRGLHCVDAPVTGGQAGAEKGRLAVMCGGSEPAVAAAKIVMQAYAPRIVHVGRAGAGQTAKMVNQICIAGVVQSLAEALRFAQAAELDLDKVFDAISGGAAQSWQMDNYWKTMAADSFDFGFAVDWMRKDLGLALEEARANGATLPVTALIDQFYADVQAMGGHRQDTSAIVRRITRA